MTKEKLAEKILQYAADSAKNVTNEQLSNYNTVGPIPDVFLNYEHAFAALENHFATKAGIHAGNNVPKNVQHATRAAMFATSVISSLYMAGRVNDGIDEFVNDPKNEQLFAEVFKDNTDEQKRAFARQLKDTVAQRLSVKPQTPEGEKFVEGITEKFNQAQTKEQRQELLCRGIAAANRMLDALDNSNNVENAIEKAKTQIQDADRAFLDDGEEAPDRSFDYFILNGFMYNSEPLSYENGGCMNQIANTIPIYIGHDNDAERVKRFLSAYDNTSNTEWLDLELEFWVGNKMAGFDMDTINATKIEGHNLFDDDQINNLSDIKKKAEVLALALKGKDVTYRDYKNDNDVIYSPEIHDTRAKTFWEKIVDFFKKMLGIDDLAEIRHGISEATTEHLNKDANLRKKTSFDEISGLKGLKKVTGSVKTNNEPTAEMNPPEIHQPEIHH